MSQNLESRVEKLEVAMEPKAGIVVVYPETTDEEVAEQLKHNPGAVLLRVVYEEERKDEQP